MQLYEDTKLNQVTLTLKTLDVWTESVSELRNSVANLSGISEESASAFKNALSVYNLGLSPEAHASMKEVARAISNTMKNRNELVFSGLTETISQFAELSKMMQPVSDSTRNLAKLLSEALNSNVESANKSANKSLNESANKSANKSLNESANKSANSADNSDVNLGYFSKRHEQIISVMDNGV